MLRSYFLEIDEPIEHFCERIKEKYKSKTNENEYTYNFQVIFSNVVLVS